MDAGTRKYISAIAQRIVDMYNISIPVNINTVVHKLGGKIKVCSINESLYDETLRKTGDTEFTIAISPSQCQNPKEAHLQLHKS